MAHPECWPKLHMALTQARQSGSDSRSAHPNSGWELRTQVGLRHCFARPGSEESHRAVAGTQPDLFGAGVEVKASLFRNLRLGISGRYHFHADFRRPGKTRFLSKFFNALGRGPGHVGRFDTIRGRDRTLCQHAALGHEVPKQMRDCGLIRPVAGRWRRTHNDASVAIRLNSPFDPGQFPIRQQFSPPAPVEGPLLFLGGQFERQRRHTRTYGRHQTPSIKESVGFLPSPLRRGVGVRWNCFCRFVERAGASGISSWEVLKS